MSKHSVCYSGVDDSIVVVVVVLVLCRVDSLYSLHSSPVAVNSDRVATEKNEDGGGRGCSKACCSADEFNLRLEISPVRIRGRKSVHSPGAPP